jgi:uncharacterized membrane protein YgcG
MTDSSNSFMSFAKDKIFILLFVISMLFVSVFIMNSNSYADSKPHYGFKSENGDIMEYHYPVFGSVWMSKLAHFDTFMSSLRSIDPELYKTIKAETGFAGTVGNFSKFDINDDGYASIEEVEQGLDNTRTKDRLGSVAKTLERVARGSEGGGGGSTGGGASSGGGTSGGGSTGGNSGGRD